LITSADNPSPNRRKLRASRGSQGDKHRGRSLLDCPLLKWRSGFDGR
jgi:hypothetical protein